MLGLINNHVCPIGVDITDDGLRMAQVKNGSGPLELFAGNGQSCPADILPGTASWQKWAINAIRNVCSENRFWGKSVVASIPPCDVLIDNIKISKNDNRDLNETVMAKARQKLTGEYETRFSNI